MNKEIIAFSDLLKVDLRVGRVVSASRVPDSKKLLALQVSFGKEERQILAGIGKSFSPEDVVDRQYLFVINLKERELAKMVSQGMILAVESEDGVKLLSPTGQVPDGTSAS